MPKLGTILPNMGMAAQNYSGLVTSLFSKGRLRVLSLFFGHPERAFHTSEIIELAQSGSGGVQREIQKLTKAGILTCESQGGRKTYRVNRQAPIFDELSRIFLKTTGLIEPVRRSLKQFQTKIRFAFVYGSIAKGGSTAKSDVDLMIVGDDLSYGDVFKALQPAEKAIRRPINPNIMTVSEWAGTRSSQSSFIKNISEQPKLMVIGTEHELQRTR